MPNNNPSNVRAERCMLEVQLMKLSLQIKELLTDEASSVVPPAALVITSVPDVSLIKKCAEDHEQGLSSSTAFHVAFGFIIVVLLGLLQVKYQSTKLSPFQTHALYMSLFIIEVFIYTATLLVAITQSNDGIDYLPIMKHICLISGALACSKLLLILVSPLGYLVSALCAFLIVRVLFLYRQQICHTAIQAYNNVHEWLLCVFKSMCNAVSQAFSRLQYVFQWLRGTFLNQTSDSSMEQQQESGGNIQIQVIG